MLGVSVTREEARRDGGTEGRVESWQKCSGMLATGLASTQISATSYGPVVKWAISSFLYV